MKIVLFLLFFYNLLFSQTFVYECQNDNNFILETRDNEAWLLTKDISMSLPRVISASGEKYKKDNIVFYSHGYEAMLDTPSKKYRQCSNNRYKAVWEDAKLRGNNFRATGNEPGWYLEIAQGGKKTLLVTDYGAEKYELSLSKPYTSTNMRVTRYRIQGFLDIKIEGKTCIDSMTGHRFSSRVTIKIDGKIYRGCGKSLH